LYEIAKEKVMIALFWVFPPGARGGRQVGSEAFFKQDFADAWNG